MERVSAEPKIWHGGPMPGGTTVPWWHGYPMPGGTIVPSTSFHDKSTFGHLFNGDFF